MSVSKDEKVDGVQIAADILLHMEPERRSRIMSQMAQKSPKHAQAVSRKVHSLDRLYQVDTRKLELALRKTTDNDIALALKPESEALKSHLYSHVSPRRKVSIDEVLTSLPPTPLRVVLAAQKRLLAAIDQGLEVIS